jgi:hypothetical protein
MTDWAYWINEYVYMNDGVYAVEKRKHAIGLFCTEGLLPLLKRGGYKVRLHRSDLIKNMLDLLYVKHKGHQAKPYGQEIDYAKEQYQYYCYRVDSEDWEQFWESWGSLQDFAEGGIGYSLRFSLPEFIWSWLDLDMSPAAIQLYKELEEEKYDDEVAKGKDDPYLQDTVRRDYQDRHWH